MEKKLGNVGKPGTPPPPPPAPTPIFSTAKPYSFQTSDGQKNVFYGFRQYLMFAFIRYVSSRLGYDCTKNELIYIFIQEFRLDFKQPCILFEMFKISIFSHNISARKMSSPKLLNPGSLTSTWKKGKFIQWNVIYVGGLCKKLPWFM